MKKVARGKVQILCVFGGGRGRGEEGEKYICGTVVIHYGRQNK